MDTPDEVNIPEKKFKNLQNCLGKKDNCCAQNNFTVRFEPEHSKFSNRRNEFNI
jgi:hypothetical protein